MTIDSFVLAYIVIYLVAFGLAYQNRKTFPFSESLLVILIVGLGFTGLTHLITLPVKASPIVAPVSMAELAFTLLYLFVVAILLVFRQTPPGWKGNFRREKLAALLFKLPVFVIVPSVVLRLVWKADWANLGFSAGDISGQLLATLILATAFGGFNLIAGSGAAPLRARKFSGRQVALGLLITFSWNIIEVGLVEEFFFRAFLQTRLINFLGAPLAGICLTALLFGLAHAPGLFLRAGDKGGPVGERPSLLNAVLYTIVVLSPTGFFTGLLFWRTQSLLAPILVHAALDTVAHTADFIEGLKL